MTEAYDQYKKTAPQQSLLTGKAWFDNEVKQWAEGLVKGSTTSRADFIADKYGLPRVQPQTLPGSNRSLP